MSLENFLASGILANDQGRPVQRTRLLDDVIQAYEGDYHTRVFVSPRRNGKSTAVALLVAFELLTRPHGFAVWVSGSGDQAADILEQKLRRPLLQAGRAGPGLEIADARDRLLNKAIGSVVQVICPSEVSAPGRTVSLLVVDEARAVPEEVVEVLRPSAAAGRIFAIGSPGPPRGWFHRGATDPGPRDFVRQYHEILNPELDPAFVEAERQRLEKRGDWGRLMFKREWEGQWAELSDNPFLRPGAVAACVRPAVEPRDVRDLVLVGCDLSVTHDLTTMAVVGARLGREGPTYRLLEAVVMDPKSYGGELPQALVEEKLLELRAKYRPAQMLVDQFQAVGLAQRLASRGARLETVAVTQALNCEAFGLLAEAINGQRLIWMRNQRLEAELVNLDIQESTSAWKVVDRAKRFHRDLSWSLALAVWAAASLVRRYPRCD